jgi:hypothetical protein
MIRKFFSSTLLIISFLQATGQITFQKSFGGLDADFGRSVCQTFDGGFLIAGSIGYTQNVLIKTNAYGDTIWTKTFGDIISGYSYYDQCIKQLKDSGYALLVNSDNLFYPNLLRINSNGDLIWAKSFDIMFSNGCSFIETSDSGFVIVGTGLGGETIYIIKTDISGIVQWTECMGQTVSTWGGSSVTQSYSGDIVISGTANSQTFIKDITSGNYLCYQGSAGTCIKQTTDSGFVITGLTGTSKFFLIKTDSILQLQWYKSYGNVNGYCSGSPTCYQTYDDGYIVMGNYTDNNASQSDLVVIKIDTIGNIQWSRLIGTPFSEWGTGIEQASDSGYVIVGTTEKGNNDLDIYFAKLDSLGNLGCNENAILMSVGNSITTGFLNGQDSLRSVNDFAISFLVGSGIDIFDPCNLANINNQHEEQAFFSVSPDPFTSLINLHYSNFLNTKISLQIFDMIGRKVFEKESVIQDQNLDLSFLHDGFYTVHLNADNYSLTRKILKSQ